MNIENFFSLKKKELFIDGIIIIVFLLNFFKVNLDIKFITNNIILRNTAILFINISLPYLMFEKIAQKFSLTGKKIDLSNMDPGIIVIIPSYLLVYIGTQMVFFFDSIGLSIIFIFTGWVLGFLLVFEVTDETILNSIYLVDVVNIVLYAFFFTTALSFLIQISSKIEYLKYWITGFFIIAIIVIFIIIKFRNEYPENENKKKINFNIIKVSEKSNAITHRIAEFLLPVLCYYGIDLWFRTIVENIYIQKMQSLQLIIIVFLFTGIFPVRIFTIFYMNKNILNKIISTLVLLAALSMIIFSIKIWF